jgi:putative ABC transport system permease protein
MQSLDPQIYELLNAEYSENYWRPSCFHFILLGQKNSIEDIENSFPAFFESHMAEFGKRLKADFELILIPLPYVHFTSQYSYDYPKGNRSYVFLFIIAGVFIFLIATLNYSSLFSSSLADRTRSFGIYKVNGAIGKQVYGLLIMESFIIMIVSSIVALFILSALHPWTSLLIEQAVFQNLFRSGGVIWLLLIIGMIIGTAFLIPVFLRVRRQPASLLKGDSPVAGKKYTLLGKGSVIFQFTLSVILIISSILISGQVNHMLEADPGYDTDNVVQVKLNAPQASIDRIASFKEELSWSPLIGRVAFSTNIPGEQLGTVYFDIDKGGNLESRIISLLGVDTDYIPLMKMELSEGRNFNPDRSTDPQRAVILNEAGVDFLGLGDSIVGTKIGDIIIIGVLKNGQYNSLHEGSKPIAFYPDFSNKGYMNIRLTTSDYSSALKYIQEVYDRFFVGIPFEATFLDDAVEEMYREDINQSRLLIIFTLISILLANMGLFGLVSLIARKRTKEIGIRKVIGARNWQVLLLLNRQLLVWLLIAIVVAIPITRYFIGLWLQNFASRIDFSWWVIAVAGLIVLFAALLTTSWITWRAANQNPVETLRYE